MTLQKILFVIDGVLVFGGVIAFIIDSPFDLPLIGAAIFLFLALEIGRHVVVEADTATAKTEGLTPTIKTESSEDNDK